MLRGRCSCAISDRLTPSSFALSSLFRPLTPLFPLHPRNSPVTPLFPLLTHKQGGGGYLCSLSVLPYSPLGVYPDPVGMVNPLSAAFSCSPLATRHSPLPLFALRVRDRSRHGRDGESSLLSDLSLATRFPRAILAKSHSSLTPIIPAPLATAALRVVPAPIFTTTSRVHVGAPTFPYLHASSRPQERPHSESSPFQPSTFNFQPFFSSKSNHSRTSERFSRKSNYSRTYAITGGWGCLPQDVPAYNSFVFFRRVNYSVKYNCRRADICMSSPEPGVAPLCLLSPQLMYTQAAGASERRTRSTF